MKREHSMIKRSVILASAALLVAAGAASAQTQMPPNDARSPAIQKPRGNMTGTPNHPASSTNPQAATGTTGQAPREVPENGGAPMKKVPPR
jgi:hypothetical protein